MLLSICMMVKNEASNLPRCLESLKTLMDKIDCELIVVDTGSEDDTVKIATQYTSKVYFHEWNHNFSDMRNITINYATGDWVFIIDADEELIDPENIVNFFRGDVANFNGAALRLDNIIKKNGDLGSTILTIRFFRNIRQFRYSGSVHNILYINGNIFELDSKLLHYGYITDDSDLMDIKFNRTRKMLADELEKNPQNIYYQFQLATTYEMHKDIELAKLHYERTYLLVKESKENKKNFIYLWGPFAKILILYKEFQRAVEVCIEGLLLADDYVDLYYFLGIAYSGISNWEMTISNFGKYLELLKNAETLAIRKNPSVQLYSLGAQIECLNNLTQAYIVLKEWKKVQEVSFELISSTEESSDFFVNGINFYVRACINLIDVDSIVELYKKYPQRVGNLDTIVYSCLQTINISEQSNRPLHEGLCKLPSKLGHIYKQLYKYIYQQAEVQIETEVDYVDYIQNNVDEALYLALIESKNISVLLSNMDEKKLMELIASVHQKFSDLSVVVESYLNQFEDSETFDGINTLRLLRKYLMIVNFDDDHMIAYMDQYFDIGTNYLRYKYSNPFLSRNDFSGYFNSEEQLLAVVLKINADNLSKAHFTRMCDFYPEWKYQIAKWFESKINNGSKDEATVAKHDLESDQMIVDLIKNIDILILEGHENEANAIIQELKKIYNLTDNELNILLNSSKHRGAL